MTEPPPEEEAPAGVVVFGSAGRLGRTVVAEAASRGHQVVGVVHQGAPASIPDGVVMVEGDATDADLVLCLAEPTDVLVSTVGGPDKTLYLQVARTFVSVARQLGERAPRIIHSGGGGSLLDPQGARFVDAPGFAEQLRPEVLGQAAALDYYRTTTDVEWTYMSPPPGNFQPGPRTGRYRVGRDQPVTDAAGGSAISYEDYAVALVDEIEHPRHLRQRFTVGY